MPPKFLHRFIHDHKNVLQLATWYVNKTRPSFSWKDVAEMAEEWCKILPNDFDCVIGIPRAGLIVADYVALNLGLPLSTPEDFLRGVSWQSKYLPEKQFKKVLVVDDSVCVGSDLSCAVDALRQKYPDTQFKASALVNVGTCQLDYCYCVDIDYRMKYTQNYAARLETPRVKRFRFNDFL
jgi:hypoxanthine phosphoribosyltransferase